MSLAIGHHSFSLQQSRLGFCILPSTDMIYYQATANTASVTSPVTTSTQYSCLSSTITPSSSISQPMVPISPPTAVPPPPIDASAQILVDDLRTIILYAELIGNDGNLAKLCSALNPAALFNETGINGTVVQNEVCTAAAIAKYSPGLAQTVVLENQSGVSFLQAALFAVQVLGRESVYPAFGKGPLTEDQRRVWKLH